MSGNRSDVVSSFTIIKGSLIPETYAAFSDWNLDESKAWNLDRIRSENTIGASSDTWLRDVVSVLRRRFEPDQRDRSLVLLAQANFPLEEWKPLLLWHMTRDEFLVADFLKHWLYPEWEGGAYRLKAQDLHKYLRTIESHGGVIEHEWKESTLKHVASGLLKIATDFGLTHGTTTRKFSNSRLPERSFTYLLHAIRGQERNAARTLKSEDWRMYLMTPHAVEQELLTMHQFKKLEYQAAGSLIDLDLPYESADAYARGLIA